MAENELDSSGEVKFEYTFYYTVAGATNQETLTGYALDNYPMTFRPAVGEQWPPEFSDKRIVWDYGDGTKSEAITGVHAYTKPGTYKVRSYIYDNLGNGYYNTFSVEVDVYDYISDSVKISTSEDILHLTGEVKNPITLVQYNSIRAINENGGDTPKLLCYAEPLTFNQDYDYFLTGSVNRTYGHLLPSYTFIQKINGTENLQVSSVNISTQDSIYVTIIDEELVTSIEPINNTSTKAGLSSKNDIYFRSDIPGDFNLLFGFEQGSIGEFTNTTDYGVSATIAENLDVEEMTITSNGIDGDDIILDAFDINPVKFSCVKSSFVIKLKDNERFTNKSLPIMDISPHPDSDHLQVDITLTDGVSTYDANFYSDFNDLSSSLVAGDSYAGYAGGFFKGYFYIDTDEVIEDVYISATTTVNGTTITGQSNTFSVFPKDYYIVAKYGEDVNFSDVFSDIAKQPLFDDTKILLNDFLGGIFGNIDSAQDSIGKSTYEKIQNFTNNNTVIDYCNIDQLASILYTVNLPRINTYSLPPKIKRLMDLLSISQSRLFGNINQNREDFNSFGYMQDDFYGLDRCSPIPEDGPVFENQNIVAFEKYSGRWTTLNSNLPLSASQPPQLKTFYFDIPKGSDTLTTCFRFLTCTPITTETSTSILVENEYFHMCLEGDYNMDGIFSPYTKYYQLSDYNDTWGWPITPDRDGTIFDVYKFYYKSSYLKTDVDNSIINFKDNNTTINSSYTYKEWSKPNGVMSHIFSNSLYDGLGLMDCELPQESESLPIP